MRKVLQKIAAEPQASSAVNGLIVRALKTRGLIDFKNDRFIITVAGREALAATQ
jgi:hypothetical protein